MVHRPGGIEHGHRVLYTLHEPPLADGRDPSPNLALLRGTPHFLALVNYNSTDDLDGFVREGYVGDQRAGNLLYFHTTAPTTFDASRAKNSAHRLALTRRPDVLFSLDADNFITPETLAFVTEAFSGTEEKFFHQWSCGWADGSCGRIAMRPASWQRLGGYDETLRGIGWVDMDLLVRARAVGLRYQLEMRGIRPAIQNTVAQKIANVGSELAGQGTPIDDFGRMNIANIAQAFSRPITLPMAEQRLYPGVIDFTTSASI